MLGLEEDAAALDFYFRQYQAGALKAGEPLLLSGLRGQPKAIYRRALQEWLHVNALHGHLTAKAVDSLLDSLLDGRVFRVSAGVVYFIVCDGERLRMEAKGEPVDWVPSRLYYDCVTYFPNGASLVVQQLELSSAMREKIVNGVFDNRKHVYLATQGREAGELFIVRNWHHGDRYRPLGAPGSRKIQDLFMDRKIPHGERKHRPIVCDSDGTPLWSPGLAPAESYKITNETEFALHLTYLTDAT